MSASSAAPLPAHRPAHVLRHDCPRHCRRARRPARHGASHRCPRSCRPGRPLNRRGGSAAPGSPASIPRSPVQHRSGFRPARAGLGVHTPRIFDAVVPWRHMRCQSPLQDVHRHPWAPLVGWTERVTARYTAIVMAGSPRVGCCRRAVRHRPSPLHERYTPDPARPGRVRSASGRRIRIAGPPPCTRGTMHDDAGPLRARHELADLVAGRSRERPPRRSVACGLRAGPQPQPNHYRGPEA